MACNNINCGCTTAGKTTLPGCDTFVCNNPNPCPKVIDSCCIKYTRDDIVDANITKGQSLCDIIPQLVTYITPPIPDCSDPNNCCGSITGFDVTSVVKPSSPTLAEFFFTWDKKENCEVSWIIQYRILSTIPWTSVNVPGFLSTLSISGLLAGVTYEFRMYAECIGEPCYSVTIVKKSADPLCNTQGYCGASVLPMIVANLTTQTSLTWSWNPNLSAAYYLIEIFSYNNSYYFDTIVPSTTSTYTAVGLSPNTVYYILVRSFCSDGFNNPKCEIAVGYKTNEECISVKLLNLSKTYLDTFTYRPCGQINSQSYTLYPGDTVTLCIEKNSLSNLNGSISVTQLGSCP